MGTSEPGCVFCEIAAGRAAAYRVYEDELSLAILDINPHAQGHVLVISKRHVVWWHELDEAENASLFKVANLVANKMMKAFSPDFVLLYARGKRIPHTHVFLVPSYNGDILDRFFNALEKVQESPHELAKLREPASMEEAAELLRSV